MGLVVEVFDSAGGGGGGGVEGFGFIIGLAVTILAQMLRASVCAPDRQNLSKNAKRQPCDPVTGVPEAINRNHAVGPPPSRRLTPSKRGGGAHFPSLKIFTER